MKVLVIGARGMLGQAMVKEFSSHEVLAWDREEIDITGSQATSYKLQATLPELVINCAAYTNVDGAEKETDLANKINGHAVGNLARVCRDLDIPIVHFSTDYVFDGENKGGYAEDAAPSPISAYGKSKLLGEEELRKNCEKYYLIRLSRLFGSTSPGLRPPSPGLGRGRGEVESSTRKKSFVQLMLDLADKQSEIEVLDEEVSSPTYAPDLARLTRQIIEDKRPFGIYHGANSGSCTWYGFAEEIFKISGKNVKLKAVAGERFKRPARRPQHSILLNTKLRAQRD